MTRFLYFLVEFMAKVHEKIMSLNDSYETYFSDKILHFLVIGIVGMLILFVIYPLFISLSKNHVLTIAFIYVFTVMVVITFAIEIGQGYTHTGVMEMESLLISCYMIMFQIIN